MRRIIAAAVLMLGLAAPAWAGFDEGLAAYKRGDYATALREWRPLAEQGDATAQNNLGTMYDEGKGTMYDEGKGVPQDYAQAVKWYKKAAEQNHAKAQSNLGVMYGNGRGVLRDYVQAHMWLAVAASLGNDLAVKYLGTIAKRMTSGQIADAQRLASEWTAKFEARKKKQ